jgi:hypothetical protein
VISSRLKITVNFEKPRRPGPQRPRRPGFSGVQCPSGLTRFGEVRADQRLVLMCGQAILRMALSQFSPRLYVGSWSLWYSFVLLERRVSDGVRGSVCDHVGYKSGTVLVFSYALTGPAALYAPHKHTHQTV